MSDSPRCLKCLGDGKIGQTYKVARTNLFKCASCGVITSARDYSAEDYTWRGKESLWFKKAQNIFLDQKNKIGLKRLKEIQDLETK